MNLFLIAISLGFVGSLHCIGMCGPIALSLPISNQSIFSRTTGVLIYNFGRIITYSFLGALFGALGKSIALAGFQSSLSIVLGILILISVILPTHIYGKAKITNHIYSKILQLKNKFTFLFKQQNPLGLFSIGLINGLLPCGLVYVAIAGATTTSDVLDGAIFMFSFGLGTIPAMATITYLRDLINYSVRNKINKIIPVYIGIMAVLLILRGLNLGIPYVSPKIDSTGTKVHACCHKKQNK